MTRLFCYEMSEPKDFRIGNEFYLSVALKAANDLRAALRIDEESFRRTGPALWPDTRGVERQR